MTAARFVDAGAADGLPSSVDVLIVGSGPVGSAFACSIAALAPSARILMVEAGPRLTERPGMHVRNIPDDHERELARRRSEGPSGEEQAAEAVQFGNLVSGKMLARGTGEPAPAPGTFFVNAQLARDAPGGTLPAAAMSCNVGGMGSHWGGATPHPRGRERIGFIPDGEWATILAAARRRLAVTSELFTGTPAWTACLSALRSEFNELPSDSGVRNMPVAARPGLNGDPPYWTGSDVVLGDLARRPRETFAIAADTLCREILVDGGRAGGAVLAHRPSGRVTRVSAKVVVVAADSLRTPQLLWASGIRPPALGRHLNDHLMLGTLVAPSYLESPEDPFAILTNMFDRGHVTNGGWIPYSDEVHPLHATFTQFELPQRDGSGRRAGFCFFGYFLPKEIRPDDRVRFLDDAVDAYGMPAIAIDYQVTEQDRKALGFAENMLARATAALGRRLPGTSVLVSPGGSSLHYMGTIRMGEHDDDASVCDSYSRVWGFENLFVGGNGVISTPTACNPTLTSVALAIRAAGKVAALTGQ